MFEQLAKFPGREKCENSNTLKISQYLFGSYVGNYKSALLILSPATIAYKNLLAFLYGLM